MENHKNRNRENQGMPYVSKVQLDYIKSEKFHFLSEFIFEVSIELQDKIQLCILGFQLFQGRYWYFVS